MVGCVHDVGVRVSVGEGVGLSGPDGSGEGARSRVEGKLRKALEKEKR